MWSDCRTLPLEMASEFIPWCGMVTRQMTPEVNLTGQPTAAPPLNFGNYGKKPYGTASSRFRLHNKCFSVHLAAGCSIHLQRGTGSTLLSRLKSSLGSRMDQDTRSTLSNPADATCGHPNTSKPPFANNYPLTPRGLQCPSNLPSYGATTAVLPFMSDASG
jgi:hypothetical protein